MCECNAVGEKFVKCGDARWVGEAVDVKHHGVRRYTEAF
jgi:hypothetical protein